MAAIPSVDIAATTAAIPSWLSIMLKAFTTAITHSTVSGRSNHVCPSKPARTPTTQRATAAAASGPRRSRGNKAPPPAPGAAARGQRPARQYGDQLSVRAAGPDADRDERDRDREAAQGRR